MHRKFTFDFIWMLIAAFLVFWPGQAQTAEDPEGEPGCTPGYWKQARHFASWPADVTPDSGFAGIFGVDAFPGQTLLDVLTLPGGEHNALGRQAVAALLSARTALSGMDSDFYADRVITMFGNAFPAGESEHEAQKDIFATFNEQDCPRGVFAWRFDFGTASSPVESGYIRVTLDSTYASDRGYGWRPGDQIEAVDRQVGDARDRDANLSQHASFRLDVPDGLYTVKVRYGDTLAHDPFHLHVEDQPLTIEYARSVSVIQTLSTDVRVSDGSIDLAIEAKTIPDDYPGPDALINSLTVERRLFPPDPTGWERTSSDVFYRRATDGETVQNVWPLGTQLVFHDPPLWDFSDPEPGIMFFAPLGQAGMFDMSLSLVGHEAADVPVVEIGFGVPSRQRQDGFLRYEAHDPSSAEIVLLADPATGGFWGRIQVSPYTSHSAGAFEIRSGEDEWFVDDAISLPDGSHPMPGALYAVLPGQGAGFSDLTSTPSANEFGFALVGEIKWCTAHRTGWAAAMAGRALYIREGFQACPGGDCTRSTDVNMVQRGLYCNITYSQEVAEACAFSPDAGACPTNEAGHDYTFLNCGTQSDCYLDRVVDNLLQARSEGFHVNELDIAQVVHLGYPYATDPGGGGAHSVCGKSMFASGVNPDDGTVVGRGGTSVVGSEDQCALLSSPHEIGHNFGAIHERTNSSFIGADCTTTMMNPAGGGTNEPVCNVFSLENAATLADCARSDDTFLDYAGFDPFQQTAQVRTRDCPILMDEPLVPAP